MPDAIRTILLIEDNPNDAALLQERLAERPRAPQVLVCRSLAAAAESTKSHAVELVILDLSLPDSHGLDTVRSAARMMPGLPIIVLTGNEDEDAGMDALRAGAQDYLVKGRISGETVWRSIRYAAERHRAQEAIRQSEQQYRLLFDRNPDGVFAVDSTGRFVVANAACEALSGYPLADLLQKTFMAICAPDRLAETAEAFQRGIRDQAYMQLETALIRKDGQRVEVWIAGEPVVSNGHVVSVHFTAKDITARKLSEEALRNVNAELERKVSERTKDLARTVASLRDEVQQRMEAERATKAAHEQLSVRAAQLRALAGELTLVEQRERRRMATVLHDHLQQLLVGAKFRVTILSRHQDPVVREATQEVERLLVESIQSSRSLTAELSPPILHEGGLGPGLEWLARRMAERHSLIVDLAIESDIPPLVEDVKVLLFESVRELLFNAVKHARVHEAWVNVRLIEGNSLLVDVGDAGPGFDPAKLRPAGAGGGGFGLFSIRERLNLMGGRLEIDSAPGKGARFTLVTPIANANATPSVALAGTTGLDANSHAIQPASPPPGTKIRVEIADDHTVMREALARLLGSEPDIEIVGQAADGQAAIDLAMKLLPDVILMDCSMPKLNGVEATRALHNAYPEIRIIGLSMFEESERAQAMRDAGAVNYMAKTGPAEGLIAAIRQCMNKKADAQAMPLESPGAVATKRTRKRPSPPHKGRRSR